MGNWFTVIIGYSAYDSDMYKNGNDICCLSICIWVYVWVYVNLYYY